MKYIIWSNRNIDVDAWRDELVQYRKEWDYENPEDVDDHDVCAFIEESLSNQLDDERINLSTTVDGDILVIADLGLWNGRRQGYKILHGNVSNIFTTGEDYTEWYSDGYNIRATATHHDGTNYYEYRIIREDRNIQNLLDAIYKGEEISRSKIRYYTKSLAPCVHRIYGWKLKGE